MNKYVCMYVCTFIKFIHEWISRQFGASMYICTYTYVYVHIVCFSTSILRLNKQKKNQK